MQQKQQQQQAKRIENAMKWQQLRKHVESA